MIFPSRQVQNSVCDKDTIHYIDIYRRFSSVEITSTSFSYRVITNFIRLHLVSDTILFEMLRLY